VAGSDDDSESDEGGAEAAAARPPRNTFRFRNFAQRLAAVDVDVHRRLGPLTAEPSEGAWRPLQGARAAAAALGAPRPRPLGRSRRRVPLAGESFFQEGLLRWRELNTAAHFASFASAVHPLCASLPLLVHHQSAILDALLARLRPEAALSLDALLSLAGLLARDLRGDFAPHAPKLFAALATLLADGADRHPEQMVRPVQLRLRFGLGSN
jgi:hypothetical protein